MSQNNQASLHSASPRRQRLITYIYARDDLPEDWNSPKRGRLSATDSEDLQNHLERALEKRGLLSGTDTTIQQYHHRRSLSFSRRPKNLQPFPRERVSTGLIDHQLWRRFKAHLARVRTLIYSINFHGNLWQQQQDFIRANAAQVLRGTLNVIEELFGYFLWFLKFFFVINKKPLCFLIAFVAAGLAILNGFANLYTIGHDSFLDSFCQEKLPLVRGFVCRDWDRIQRPPTIDPVHEGNINKDFTKFLSGNETSRVYKLPHYLIGVESTIRYFRATIPESEYSSDHGEQFHAEFTEYIDYSRMTTHAVQEFYAHIMQTIRYHMSDTNWLVKKMNSSDLSSDVAPRVNGTLARTMAFLESHRVVYLCGGVEPFQRDVLQEQSIEVMDIMIAYVTLISAQLQVDVHMAAMLERNFENLSDISSKIQRHISQFTAESAKENSERGTLTKLMGLVRQTYNEYQLNQRQQSLDQMRPVFKETARFMRAGTKTLGRNRGMSVMTGHEGFRSLRCVIRMD